MFKILPFLLFFAGAVCADISVVPTPDGEEIPVVSHSASGELLFVWFPSEAGPQVADVQLAQQLTQQGVEIWRVDLLEAHFLPPADSSLLQVPDSDVAAVLESALHKSGKKVFLIANGSSAIPVLRGVRHWQLEGGDDGRFAGVILISPKLFVQTPDPGEAAELFPVVAASNVPIYWLQPDQSPWYWKLAQLIPALESGGSDVFVRVLRGVRDRFYFRPDAKATEDVMREQLPALLLSAAEALNSIPTRERRAVAMATVTPTMTPEKKANTLKVYRSNRAVPLLRLRDLSGKRVSLNDYRGYVVLVNFWASWCPPCVHEMPSMQRLADALSDRPFEILAVNMAESPMVIREFLETKVSVDFPILLDSDGDALQRWQVFAFPTSYIVDKSGQIRYALFGAAEWDESEIQQRIRKLLRE